MTTTTTNTNQNVKIRRLPYTRMLKSEMADYADRVIDIVQNSNPESAIFNPLFEALLAKEAEIGMLRLSYGVDTERLRVDKLKGDMMLVISAFKLNVRIVSRSNVEIDIHVVQNAIDSYLRYFNRCRNDKQLNQKIVGFLNLMYSNKAFATAVRELNLVDNINEIKRAHALFYKALKKRVNLLSKRPKFSTKDIIKEVFDAIDNLFKGIEVAQLISSSSGVVKDSEADYSRLINELRQLSDMYYKSYSIRKANNRRKLEKEQIDDVELNLEELPNGSENSVEVATSTEEQLVAISSNGDGVGADIHPCLSQEESCEGATHLADTINLNDKKHKPSDKSINSYNQSKVLAKRELLLGASPPRNS